MPFISLSLLTTSFRVWGLYPSLAASVAMWLTLAIGTGTDMRRTTAISLALKGLETKKI